MLAAVAQNGVCAGAHALSDLGVSQATRRELTDGVNALGASEVDDVTRQGQLHRHGVNVVDEVARDTLAPAELEEAYYARETAPQSVELTV